MSASYVYCVLSIVLAVALLVPTIGKAFVGGRELRPKSCAVAYLLIVISSIATGLIAS